MTITLFDQMRAFDFPKYPSTTTSVKTPLSSTSDYSSNRKTSVYTQWHLAQPTAVTIVSQALLNSYGIIHDEWNETSYLGMNILLNVISSNDFLDICAQTSAKINTILHSKQIQNYEEACYLIANIDRVINEKLKDNDDANDQYYAFLIPIMKCLIEKCYNLLQMNVQVPNITSYKLIANIF